MATISIFSMGEPASASAVNQAFGNLVSQGNSILNTMSEIQLNTLVDYQRALTAIIARQQRAAKVSAYGLVARFDVTDLSNVNQGNSTATIRIDAGVANLRERRQPSQVLVSSTQFTSSTGSIQSIDNEGTLFSVYSESEIPTGTFILTLSTKVDVSFLTLDIPALSSQPTVAISVSENGLSWQPATNVALSGSTLNAWIPETPTKYIQVIITPSHPDNLGGYTYTFGITDLSGTSVDYNLTSDIFFLPQTFNVATQYIQLVADNQTGLTYFLTLDDGTPADLVSITASPNTSIAIPGVTQVTTTGTTTSGVLSTALPGNYIPGTISVSTAGGTPLAVIPGLSTSDPNISYILDERVSLVGTTLTVLPHPANATSFSVSYLTGSETITATLRVHLSTDDSTLTPIFNGAYIEDII